MAKKRAASSKKVWAVYEKLEETDDEKLFVGVFSTKAKAVKYVDGLWTADKKKIYDRAGEFAYRENEEFNCRVATGKEITMDKGIFE